MDYNKENEEYDSYLPRRTDKRYERIEKFKPYELTHCIVFEMAGRNEKVRKSIELIACMEEAIKIKDRQSQDITDEEFLNSLTENDVSDIYNKDFEELEKKRHHLIQTYEEGINNLKNQYLLHYNQNAVNIPEIENPFKEKDLTSMSIDESHEYLSDLLRSPFMKHMSAIGGKFLHGDEYSQYKSDHNKYEGFITARGIDTRCKTFNISSINTYFQRKIYDTNQINVALNMSLPEKELIEYIKHIKRTLSDQDSKELKSPNKLLGKDVKEAKRTNGYPKIQTAKKLADMFFVYDYVNSRLKQIENDRNLIEKEYKHNQNQIKNDWNSTDSDKKIQLNVLKNEYDENKVTIGIEDIFKDFDKPMENINFKGSSSSNYYYTLKPYIEECRYPEFLTGESVIKEEIEKII